MDKDQIALLFIDKCLQEYEIEQLALAHEDEAALLAYLNERGVRRCLDEIIPYEGVDSVVVKEQIRERIIRRVAYYCACYAQIVTQEGK